MNALTTRALTDRRVNDYCVWTDHRQSERRVSPVIGEFAIGEAHRFRVGLKLIAEAPPSECQVEYMQGIARSLLRSQS